VSTEQSLQPTLSQWYGIVLISSA